ncbi:inactive serine/threonine-protein kinase TEX14 isoform 2-T2 [Clarias gariepinus]|uniref:inactive serine/threonine-protein kinase TEX14-like isoform X2 n=1 Tax=Clarias gariepinus TaxID=13013 RepID=UPI00234D1212|nr:inactive serine/threonine-protein kinase TEX14-like isoform X2 [Clarias gariepinus]
MAGVSPVPCPVTLGSVRTGGAASRLHRFTREKNLHEAEKLLKQGVDVDGVNDLGQTSLFCASLLGFTASAKLLLLYGADPNHRCDDWSTPVHAAVFSCDTRLLSELLEAGGDLRLHDHQGRTPRDWAEIGAQQHSSKMVGFIKSCTSAMRSLSVSQSSTDRRGSPTSPKSFLRSPSLLGFFRPDSDGGLKSKLTTKSPLADTVQCFGFGKLCVEKPGTPVGVLSSVPLTSDPELYQTEEEALHSFSSGTFIRMTNCCWRGGIRVTVRELQIGDTHQHAERHAYLDLITTELGFCSRLSHPHLLQLMAVSIANDLKQNKLVYERVHVGSLYSLLYHRRLEFHVLQVEERLLLILQVCEALSYLHSQCLVLRSLSSHSVLLVHPGVAKITDLGFIVPSDYSPSSAPPVPVTLYNWAAPEVIRGRSCKEKADLYSTSALIQELYTDSVPWGSVDPRVIRHAVCAGEALAVDPAVPQPYHDLLRIGLKPRPQDRTCSLLELRHTLRSDLRELRERERRRSEVRPLLARSSPDDTFPDTPSEKLLHNMWRLSPRPPEMKECHLATQSSVCDYISSIAVNLKVCQYLLKEVESSLERSQSKVMVQQVDEPDGLVGLRDRQVVMKAVGPPSSTYIPHRLMDKSVTEFCSAEEESFGCSEAEKNICQRDWRMREGHQKAVRFVEECDGMSQSSVMSSSQELTLNHRAEDNWTSGVSVVVGRVAQGFLSCTAGALGSDSEEECRPLLDTQKDTRLEQLFKRFAGVHSDSEESTDFHTINHTFTSPTAVSELNGQHAEEEGEDSADSHYTQSPGEPSSIFYSPKLNLYNTKNAKEELAQMSSSEDDPDVTMEVCCPCTPMETTFREFWSSPDEPELTGAESVPLSVHTNSHGADIADLSSIGCTPAHLQEWVVQNGASLTACSTRIPPCNSTPRNPHVHTGQGCSASCRKVCVPPHVPPPQSPWPSTESLSHSETHNTPRLQRTETVSALHQHTDQQTHAQGDSDTPGSGNPEYTTTITESRQCEGKKKSQDHSHTPVTVLQCDTRRERCSCETAWSTKRAHSTLDEVLQDFQENPEAQRTVTEASAITDVSAGSEEGAERKFGQSESAERGIRDQLERKEEVMEERRCSGGDTMFLWSTPKEQTSTSDVRNRPEGDVAHHTTCD